MNDDKIKKNYSKKIKLFEKYNQYYYEKSKPLITDQEFDKFKNEIIQLEKKYPFLKNNELSQKRTKKMPIFHDLTMMTERMSMKSIHLCFTFNV